MYIATEPPIIETIKSDFSLMRHFPCCALTLSTAGRINPTMLIHDIEYYHNQIKSESDRSASNGSSTVLSWKLTISADGTKQMSAYDPYWFFYPTAISSSSAGYIKKGILGVPNGTSAQQLFQTGKLVETLKESLINAGENVTLEEV